MKLSTLPRWFRLALPYLAVAAVTLLLWRGVIFTSELLLAADMMIPTNMPALRRLFFPFWNEGLEFPNVETANRLAWMTPFLLLPNPVVAQKLMFVTVLVGSGWSMLAATRRLGAPVVLALLAGILYATNPWVANRLQHYFLLPGYTVLPLVLALWLRPLRRADTLVLALLLTLGSTSPHYTAFLWLVSGLWLLFHLKPKNLRRFAGVTGLYTLFNLYWLVPTLAFMRTVSLVPSDPTWEQVRTFSERATLFAVARLQGYWWPLAEVGVSTALTWLGLGLFAAALLALVKPNRTRLFFWTGALCFGLVALGTRVPWLAGVLVVESPFAERLGWLFRDPNKAVGPLAALLLLAATSSSGSSLTNKATYLRVSLLGAYAVFAVSVVTPYLNEAYTAHAPPPAFEKVNDYLATKSGRSLWVPHYFGAQTLWNGTNLTPPFPSYSSTRPVLNPYDYRERSLPAYLTLYFGGLLGDVGLNVPKVMQSWGARWLVHSRDLRPYRQQRANAFNNRVELLPFGIAGQALEEVLTVSPLSVYNVGESVSSYRPSQTYLTENPLAALATFSNTSWQPDGVAFVETWHEGVDGLALSPGDDARVLLAQSVNIDLAKTVTHYAPGERWSRLNETDLAWWAEALRVGLPPAAHRTLLTTERVGAEVTASTDAPAGRYRLLLRAYQGPRSGAVRLQVGETAFTAELAGVTARSQWLELGEVALDEDAEITLTNLDGSNVVAALKLVPTQAWHDAATTAADLPTSWLWSSSTFCRDLPRLEARAPLEILPDEHALPLTRQMEGDTRWAAYSFLTLDMYGDGSGTPVQAWTLVDNTWLQVGEVRAWWRGWRTVDLPIRAQAFSFVAVGTGAPLDNLKLIPAAGTDALRVRVRGVQARVQSTCPLRFHSSRATQATLNLLGTSESLTGTLNGETTTLKDGASVPVREGVNTLELPLEDAVTLSGLLLADAGLRLGAAGTRLPVEEGVSNVPCALRWQLIVPDELYLEGKRGALTGERLEATPVNYLRQGYWVPPEQCGDLEVQNTWQRLGHVSLGASLVSFGLALLGVVLRERGRREV